MAKNKLDFIVIGAAKSGTTSLHEILKDHPNISLPKAKEVPFFNDDKLLEKGSDWYLSQHFNQSEEQNLWGTVTPQYMYYRGGHSINNTAKQIKKHNPKVKLIVIMRHPIKRAFSHYKSGVRRYGITESFDEHMTNLISSKNVEKLRNNNWDYKTLPLFGSEYGKLLKPYYQNFDARNIKVLFFEDLVKNPEKVVKELLKFIGASADVNLKYDQKANPGGMKPKIPLLTQKYTYKIPLLRQTYRTILPYKLRKIIEVNINSWNAKPDNTKLDSTTKLYKQIVKHYKPDVKLLTKLTKKRSPWSEFN